MKATGDIGGRRGRWLGVFVAVLAVSFFGIDGPERAWADDWRVEAGDEREREIVERYLSILEDDPGDEDALRRLVDHVGRGEGLATLIDRYRERAEDRPQRVEPRLILGHLERMRGRYERAAAHYDRALEVDEEFASGWVGRGTARLNRGDRQGAMEDFERALEYETDDRRRVELLEQLGELAFSHQQFDQGKKYWQRVIDQRPRDRRVRMDYVQLLVQYRQFDEALRQYEALESLVATDAREKANVLRDKAEVHELTGDHQAALATRERALEAVRPDSWLAREIRQGIVEAYRQGGRLEEFLDDYGAGWERGGPDRQMAVADVYAELGALEEALEVYRRLARRDPSAVEAREKTVRVLRRLGRADEIAGVYRELIEARPRTERYVFELAEHHLEHGDRSAARQVLDQARDRFAGRSRVLVEIADQYRQWNFNERADQTYRSALEEAPEDPAVVVDVGDYFYERGERSRALEIWATLPESRLGDRRGRRRQAEVLVDRGEIEEGLAVYDRLLEETADDPRLLRASARALEDAEQWAEAIERWERLLELVDRPRQRREARARIVELHERRHRLESRIVEWADTWESREDEEAIEAGLLLAEARTHNEQFDRAEAILTAIREHPALDDRQRASVLGQLERLYVRAGRFDDAVEVVERLVEKRPEQSGRLTVRKSEYALEAGRSELALETARRALQRNPGDVELREHLGDLLRDLGDDRAAIDQYRAAVDIDPDAHEVRLQLGRTLIETGAIREAEDVLMEVVEGAASGQLIRDAGRLMLATAVEHDRLDALETRWARLVFQLPMDDDHARLVSRLYDEKAGPLVLGAHHGEDARRDDAREQLEELGGRAATLLVEQLRSGDGAARSRALRRVAEMNLEMATPQVGRLIEEADDERIRRLAVVTAARLGDRRLVDPVSRQLEAGTDLEPPLLVWALGHLEGDRARELLVETLEGPSTATESALAAQGLAGREITPELEEAVAGLLGGFVERETDVDLPARLAVVALAARLVEDRESPAVRAGLERLAADDRGPVATAGARALGGAADAEAAESLWRLALAGEPRSVARGEAGLKRMLEGTSTPGPDWHRDVRHFDWRDGRFDAEGLVEQRTRRAVGLSPPPGPEVWTEPVEAGLAEVVAEAETTVGETTFDRIRSGLVDEARPGFWTRQRATQFARTLREADPAGSGAPLLELLAGEIEAVVEGAAGSDDMLARTLRSLELLELDGPQGGAVELVRTGLDHPDAAVRRLALEATAAVAGADEFGPRETDRVLELLEDDRPAVRIAAARASARLGLDEALEVFDEIERHNPPPTVRRAVREARRQLEDSDR